MNSGTCLMWSPVGPHVQWNLSNVVSCGTCLIWSPMGPYVLQIKIYVHTYVRTYVCKNLLSYVNNIYYFRILHMYVCMYICTLSL